jgi:hypothetical protein
MPILGDLKLTKAISTAISSGSGWGNKGIMENAKPIAANVKMNVKSLSGIVS